MKTSSSLILSYLVFLFVAPWCHVHDVDREQIVDEGYHCHPPIVNTAHTHHESKEDKHREDNHHWLTSHHCILVQNDKFIIHNGNSFDKNIDISCQTSPLWLDIEDQTITSGSCCTLTPGSFSVTVNDMVILLFTDLPPPVC